MFSADLNATNTDTDNYALNDTELAIANITLLNPGTNPLDYVDHEPWNSTGKYVVGIVLSILIFISVVGNTLVCLAIYSSRRLRKLGNIFLGSLAVADLFVSVLVETFALANDFMNRWIFGRKFCEVWIAFDVMCCTASILNLCAISLDRFVHIKDPLKYSRLVTRRVVCLAVASIWLLSVLMSFVPVTLGWHKPNRFNPDDEQCFLDLTPTYAVVSSTISFYLPSIVMVVLYSRLFVYARKHSRNIRAVTKPYFKATRSGSTNSSSSLWRQSTDHKAAITLGVIMGTFLVCWFPFFCVNVTVAFCKNCVSKFTFSCLTWLGYLNSALNPIIYSIFNTEFRKAFKRIFVTYVHGRCCLEGVSRKDSQTSWSRWNGRRRSPVFPSSEMTTLGRSSSKEDTPMITEI